MTELSCPPELNDETAAEFVNKIWRAKGEDIIVLNFSSLHWVYPAGVMVLAIATRALVKKRKNLDLTTQAIVSNNKGACSYLSHFGFFQFVGLPVGNPINSKFGNNKYIPIRCITENSFNTDGNVLQEEIWKYSTNLVTVLYPNSDDSDILELLGYCLREIMRNVFEHSESDECYFMAQRWANGASEIVLADEGVGIATSLSHAHSVISNRNALRLALKPGISSATEPLNRDQWQNSGFGLYVVSSLCNVLGSFSILSNGTMLLKEKGKDKMLATPSKGTIVKLRIEANLDYYFPNLMNKIISDGEDEAKNIPGSRPVASKASKMMDSTKW
jgi:hypothetical protein